MCILFLESRIHKEVDQDGMLTRLPGFERENCEESPAACAGARKCGLTQEVMTERAGTHKESLIAK